MSTIFSKIIAGEIPAHKVAEDDQYIAFLDINPVQKGHTLVVPKTEVDYIYDLDDATLAGLQVFAKKVAKGIEKVVTCNRIGVVVLGLEIPHAHVHLIPMNNERDVEFSKGRMDISDAELQEMAAQIREQIDLN